MDDETYSVIRFTVFFYYFAIRINDYILFTFSSIKINTPV